MADPKPVVHRKADPDRRSEQLHLRISPLDKAVFTAAARKAHVQDVSQWARMVMLTAAEGMGVTYDTVAVPAVEPEAVEKVAKVKGSAKGPKAAPLAPKSNAARSNG